MIIKTLDELREVDSRTLAFTPMGLGVGVRMCPEESTEFQQQVVAQFELADEVPDGTRASFEDLRKTFAYGVFCYEIFTLVNDRGLLVLEQALRDRFVDYHKGTVSVVDPEGARRHIPAATYMDVYDVVGRKGRWQLLLADGQAMAFRGGLSDLRTWARRLGMLRGQRNRAIERAITDLRNMSAHPSGYHLVTPADAAHTLSDLAEIINHLWGSPTPGGRLYPAPLRREVVVLTWNTSGTKFQAALAEELSRAVEPTGGPWPCVIVRAVFHPEQCIADPGLRLFDSHHEVTEYPVDLLWGPGTKTEAAAWHAEHRPEPDDCDYLDRTFAVRHDGTNLYLPMLPMVAAALPEASRSGRWYTIKADHPNDAHNHVRSLITGAGCNRRGECRQCQVQTLDAGSHQQVIAQLVDMTTHVPPMPPNIATPWAQPRCQPIT